ncbi:haloacid dehalogenase-like hydrolase [Tepidibacillus marianensis]|uniref:DUF7916 family protein n=1 Tax=Tepidibacillus marianensis TaxID=3131995 RepID=UPI0030CF66F3
MAKGGRSFVVGAGTSGRLGVLDAVELIPTFSIEPEKWKGIIAGGHEAMWNPLEENEDNEQLVHLPEGRLASEKALTEAKKLGFDFVCLTGNPKTGVSNLEIKKAIETARSVFGKDGLIIAGKMHGAGVEGETGEDIVTEKDIQSFIEAGADIILLPSPGTVPGITIESLQQLIKVIHKKDALALLTIGTSQEGADEGTIRQIALNSKMAGADLYHIGDAGYAGIAIPENITVYSIVVRGKRHTYVRMASSILR